jgi:hypothetical protein
MPALDAPLQTLQRANLLNCELIYNFSIKVPFLVLFADAYSARKHSSFDGFETYLVACCGMTCFASMEPSVHAHAKKICQQL